MLILRVAQLIHRDVDAWGPCVIVVYQIVTLVSATSLRCTITQHFMSTRVSLMPSKSSILHLHRCANYSANTRPAMTGTRQNGPRQHRNQRSAKRPPLTHFLCLPLVNSTSLPQLEESLAAFKAAYPPAPVSAFSSGRDQYTPEQNVSLGAIPEGALRPLGTLHLTLGVMSLPTKETLEEAMNFFRSLDLAALMHEAERVAIHLRQKRSGRTASVETTHRTNQPLSISLESLHALPRAKAATVLHASPVDPTGRLYPFCVMLRDKFLEAGFMQPEAREKPPNQQNHVQQSEPSSLHSASKNDEASAQTDPICEDMEVDDKPLLNELPSGIAEEIASDEREQQQLKTQSALDSGPPKILDPYTAALARRPKPRPLLLHATLVNTIYVKGRPRPQRVDTENTKRRRFSKPGRLEFDARDLMAQYRDYYTDDARMTPRVQALPTHTSQSVEQDMSLRVREGPASSASSEEEDGHKRKHHSSTSSPRYPFVWAKEIPIDSVCICEMGAKKLDVGAGDSGLNARLGEKYTVVARRSLEPGESPVSPAVRRVSQDSVDGGVKLK